MAGFDALDDAALVTLCQRQLPRDQRAYSCLVKRHEPGLYRFVLQMLGDSAAAEDVTQDAFMQVFHNIGSFEGRSAFRTWLFSIARNGALMALRGQRRYQQRMDELALQAGDEAVDDEQLEHRQELAWLLNQLDTEQREVLSLRYLVGFELQEIADTLGIKLSAAKMRLYRATEAAQALTARHRQASDAATH